MKTDARQTCRTLLVTVKGHGEISAWLHPLTVHLKERAPDLRIVVALRSGLLTSGRETVVLRGIREVDEILSPEQTRAAILTGSLPGQPYAEPPGCLLGLGDATVRSLILARRLGCPALYYGEIPPLAARLYDRIFLAQEPAGRLNGERVMSVGNLMIDSIRLRHRRQSPSSDGRQTIALFPGSRGYHAQHLLPVFMKIARLVSADGAERRWLIAKSPFLALEQIREIAARDSGRAVAGDSAVFESGDPFGALVTQAGLRFEIQPLETVLDTANLALTIPGTNTAELAIAGIPMVVIVPTEYLACLFRPGLAAVLLQVPLVRRLAVGPTLQALRGKGPFFALPNRWSGREVVPELTGDITVEEVAQYVRSLTPGRVSRLAAELRSLAIPAGGADILAGQVLLALERSEP
jgi:lipid-A-disaccharide synthase